MTDFISRAEAIRAICEDGTKLERQGQYGMTMVERKQRDADILETLPPVDAVPVVHGTWKTVEDWDGDEHYKCSVCGDEWFLEAGDPKANNMNYCPNCGARMDGKDGDSRE